MKRKYIDRSKWQRIEKCQCVLFNTVQQRFEGYASAIFIEKVHEKLMCDLDRGQFCLADDGYVWIQRLPIDKNWAVTTMYDENSNIV